MTCHVFAQTTHVVAAPHGFATIYSKFYQNPLRGFGALGGRNLPFPITLAICFYNILYYRTSRDEAVNVTLPMKGSVL